MTLYRVSPTAHSPTFCFLLLTSVFRKSSDFLHLKQQFMFIEHFDELRSNFWSSVCSHELVNG